MKKDTDLQTIAWFLRRKHAPLLLALIRKQRGRFTATTLWSQQPLGRRIDTSSISHMCRQLQEAGILEAHWSIGGGKCEKFYSVVKNDRWRTLCRFTDTWSD